jgi:hypothetical protein
MNQGILETPAEGFHFIPTGLKTRPGTSSMGPCVFNTASASLMPGRDPEFSFPEALHTLFGTRDRDPLAIC